MDLMLLLSIKCIVVAPTTSVKVRDSEVVLSDESMCDHLQNL